MTDRAIAVALPVWRAGKVQLVKIYHVNQAKPLAATAGSTDAPIFRPPKRPPDSRIAPIGWRTARVRLGLVAVACFPVPRDDRCRVVNWSITDQLGLLVTADCALADADQSGSPPTPVTLNIALRPSEGVKSTCCGPSG